MVRDDEKEEKTSEHEVITYGEEQTDKKHDKRNYN
jgi:hypothetical protein